MNIGNTNYNGGYLDVIYSVFDTGNEVAEQGLAVVETGIKKKKALPRMTATADPFGDYTAGAPVADTASTTYAERELVPEPMTLFEKFLPEELDDLWEPWQSDGDFTNAEINGEILNALLELKQNGMGNQIARLFWQGDKTLPAANALNKFNGVVTRAIADVNVPKTTPAGVITGVNVAAIVKDFWTNIPDVLIDNVDYKIVMNRGDYKLLQLANLALKEAFDGILDQAQLNLFLGSKIIGLSSMPKNYVIGGIMNVNKASSNLFMGVDQDEKSEKPRIERMSDGSKYWFIRIDVKADANYREASELLLYEPA